MEQIGPMKTFRNKKAMWTKIKKYMVEKLGSLFTETQIENRYKTIIKRNNTTGSSPMFNNVDEEFRKIIALDDSIDPSVCVG